MVGRVRIQNRLDELKEWAEVNFKKSNSVKKHVKYKWERRNSVHKYK